MSHERGKASTLLFQVIFMVKKKHIQTNLTLSTFLLADLSGLKWEHMVFWILNELKDGTFTEL